MKILNIESATSICSIAISVAGAVKHQAHTDAPYQHTSQITLLIEECTKSTGIALKDLDAIAVSMGPGSYTALRVGLSTAKGICFALQKPLIGISTLKALAQGVKNTFSEPADLVNTLICPMIDARRMEVYTTLYDAYLGVQGPDEAKIIDENSYQPFFELGKKIIFTGDGSEKCKAVIHHTHAFFDNGVASASNMVPLAEDAFRRKDFLDVAYAEPFYLKPPNITTPKKLL
ncbi:MAG: tRNA (adenosine(37)-N6)-threonylcarbamoyltransferase complex dimerization subunit type 1 TsaB [Bacteroidota bacterium]